MEQFLQIAFSFPTAAFSALLSLVVVYWLFVILGAVDVDLFGLDGAAEGAADGAAEGFAEGIAEGAVEGLAEGAAEGAAEGIAEGLAEGAAEGLAEGAAESGAESAAEATEGASGTIAAILSVLKLRKAPITVILSCLILYQWALLFFGTLYLKSLVPLPALVFNIALFVVASTISLFATSLTVRPLAPLFVTHRHLAEETIIGHECIVRTGRVTDKFGEANFITNHSDLLLSIRCDRKNDLKRGSRALIVGYDPSQDVYHVEPLEELLYHNHDHHKSNSMTLSEKIEAEVAQEVRKR